MTCLHFVRAQVRASVSIGQRVLERGHVEEKPLNRAIDETAAVSQTPSPARRLHPWPLRVMHWVNAAVMLVMITSGWGIYDDDVIVRGLHFSGFWRLGDWAAWSVNWHTSRACGSWSPTGRFILPTASSPDAFGRDYCRSGPATGRRTARVSRWQDR